MDQIFDLSRQGICFNYLCSLFEVKYVRLVKIMCISSEHVLKSKHVRVD